MQISYHVETWPLAAPFRIANHVWPDVDVLVVELRDGEHCGRGEASGVFYVQDDAEHMAGQLRDLLGKQPGRLDRRLSLAEWLPAGGARNAVDCALWDLEAKRSGRRAWQRPTCRTRQSRPLTALESWPSPAGAAEFATRYRDFSTLKIKLGAHEPLQTVEAIRNARPDARLVIDANQSWTLAQLKSIAPSLQALGVTMIEQPLPRGADADLAGYDCPVTLCADESFLSAADFDHVTTRYRMVNIKLDKAGGLTEAMSLARGARQRGLGLMVGNMLGTSLAMAPGFLLAQLVHFVDLDGPLFLRADRPFGFQYDGDRVYPNEARLWG
ncbi:MAG: dipeptide epimerase [Proteobacteria bacterium]|nr:dipeptide epimerase [Pseudomonadota bacterium]